MGVLPWVSLVLLSLSILSWAHLQYTWEETFLTILDTKSSLRDTSIQLQSTSEKSKLAYEAMALKSKQTTPPSQNEKKEPSKKEKKHKSPTKTPPIFQSDDEFIPEYEDPLARTSGMHMGPLIAHNPELKLSYKVHFNDLFSGQPTNEERKKVEKIIFTRILETSYSGLISAIRDDTTLLALRENEEYDRLTDAILHEMEEKKEQLAVLDFQRLANLEFDNFEYSTILYRILKGGSVYFNESTYQFPTILQLVTLKKRPTILCLYLAPRAILNAITDSPKSVDAIIAIRAEIYKDLCKSGSGKPTKEIKEPLQERFKTAALNYISQDIPSQYIDFSISKTAPRDR